jgi:IS30 family transposase
LIYQWKWDSKKDNTSEDNPYKTIYNHLKHGRRRRKRGSRKDSRGIIHNRVSIEKRPKVVKQQERVGDMESYFMVGKNHKGALLIIIDRASLYNRLNKLKTRNSKKVSKTMIKRLEKKARTHYIQ